MLVDDAMTRAVVTVPVDESLRAVVALMLEHDVESVVVERDGNPTGIVTVSDVLEAAYNSGEPLEATDVETAMSHPLVTVAPETTIRTAVERMREADVKRLAVVDGIDLVGIVTQSDVVRNHALLLREAVHNEERRQRFEDEDAEPR